MWVTGGEMLERKKFHYVYLWKYLKIHFTISTFCAVLLTFPLV